MTEVWKKWEGHVVNGALPLHRFLGGSDHSGVFLTEYPPSGAGNAAIKLVPADPALTEATLWRWRMAATLSHPHLVRVMDCGRCQLGETEFLFVIMEYADQNLAEILPRRPLTEVEVGELLEPTLAALRFLHQENLVQAQLRPSNILVVNDQLKLASDTVHAAGEFPEGIDKTSVYDPPEAKSGRISTAADLWALGITMVESLTQAVPTGPAERAAEVRLPPELSDALTNMIRSCLSADPQKRPTVGQLLEPAAPAIEELVTATTRAPSAPERKPTPSAPERKPTPSALEPTRTAPAAMPSPAASAPARPTAPTAPVPPPAPSTRAARPVPTPSHTPPVQPIRPTRVATPARSSPVLVPVGSAEVHTPLPSAPRPTPVAPASIPQDTHTPMIATAPVGARASWDPLARPEDPPEKKSILPIAVAVLVVIAAIFGGFRYFGHQGSAAAPTADITQGSQREAQTAPPTSAASATDVAPAAAPPVAASPPVAAAPPVAASPPSAAAQVPSSGTSASTVQQPRSSAVLHEEIPSVPRSARDTIRGHVKVAVRVTVDRSGNVVSQTLDNPGPSKYFAHLATQAARKWKFAATDRQQSREWLLRFEFSRDGTTGHAVPTRS
jgi:TonB family protein